MSVELAATLNLPLAWARAKKDLSQRRAFVCHPFMVDLIDQDSISWLRGIQQQIAEDGYHPDPCRTVSTPKPGFLVRPGADLSLEDQVIYGALLAAAPP